MSLLIYPILHSKARRMFSSVLKTLVIVFTILIAPVNTYAQCSLVLKGDFDNDADVDLTDWSSFLVEVGGPDSAVAAGSECGDFDDDGDIDLVDALLLGVSFSTGLFLESNESIDTPMKMFQLFN